MNSAIDRLAEQLMKLSDDEWARARERWNAGLGWNTVFGDAWEEISERVAAIDVKALLPADSEEPMFMPTQAGTPAGLLQAGSDRRA